MPMNNSRLNRKITFAPKPTAEESALVSHPASRFTSSTRSTELTWSRPIPSSSSTADIRCSSAAASTEYAGSRPASRAIENTSTATIPITTA